MININGIVQGVGFRPFVFNLARACHICGWVNNSPGGVHIDAEGGEEDVEDFIRRLKEEAPPLSFIDTFCAESAEPAGYSDFAIRASSAGDAHEAFVSPDVSVCDDCLREMNDPNDRRYRYPFINCTNCGPRFTITADIPYDRVNTTMRAFEMCGECAGEYRDPSDRRFHAQPVACDCCGPALSLLDCKGGRVSLGSEIEKTVELLREGKIVAVKGLGGYHLACDAKNRRAVQELRERKKRDGRPFALMAKDMDVVLKYCCVHEKQSEILQSNKRPIVLLERKPETDLPIDFISPDHSKIGIMLPYTPVHHLLFSGGLELLVMTSGNRSGEPICYKDDEAMRALSGIADCFLTNDRGIYIRTDDSVTDVFRGREYMVRRSRGYVPLPVDISAVLKSPDFPADKVPSVLACGGELKNTFCLTKGGKAFISHHIGDLENLETLTSFETGIEHFERIFSVAPDVVAFDRHPDYLSARYACQLADLEKIPVQHHRAHIASCMAENNLTGRVIGVAFDGTGYGDDGRIWGGEFFVGGYEDLERQAHFEYLPLPGGEIAIKEPWRMAVSYLFGAYGEDLLSCNFPFLELVGKNRAEVVMRQIKNRFNTPLTSSVGRMFDAVSSIIGLCNAVEYEGQAAIRLEKSARAGMHDEKLYPYEIISAEEGFQISTRQMIAAIAENVLEGMERSRIAGAFHRTIAAITLDICRLLRDKSGISDVALSGGVFQNLLLLGLVADNLEKEGFRVYIHGKVPANDGGISLGQAVIALRKCIRTGMQQTK